MPYACGIAAVALMPKLQPANDITGAERVGQRTARLLRRTAMILATLVIICVAGWASIALWFLLAFGAVSLLAPILPLPSPVALELQDEPQSPTPPQAQS